MAREIIDRNVLGRPFASGDVGAMNATLETTYLGFERRHNLRHPSDPRHLFRLDEHGWESLSWNKCISPVSDAAKAKSVLRDAIAPCVAEAREALGDACEHCGSEDHIQVDHTDPSFDEIANHYLKDTAPEIQPHPSGSGWIFSDMDMEAEWIAFHAARATYQALCRSCNASKGKRGMSYLQGKVQDLFA